MPIYSRRFSLWTRLYTRMLLEPTGADNVTPSVSEVVVPVLDADSILRSAAVAENSIDLSGSGYVEAFSVPEGEEWQLLSVYLSPTAVATRVKVVINGTAGNVEAASTALRTVNLRDIVLSEFDTLGAQGTGDGADTGKYFNLIYNTIKLTV
ncbi:MAG TPA: hypothetical protein EYN66_20260 [Myxococcales bacterium]|nr:hypothetical protein [Myxococcales bacterium]